MLAIGCKATSPHWGSVKAVGGHCRVRPRLCKRCAAAALPLFIRTRAPHGPRGLPFPGPGGHPPSVIPEVWNLAVDGWMKPGRRILAGQAPPECLDEMPLGCRISMMGIEGALPHAVGGTTVPHPEYCRVRHPITGAGRSPYGCGPGGRFQFEGKKKPGKFPHKGCGFLGWVSAFGGMVRPVCANRAQGKKTHHQPPSRTWAFFMFSPLFRVGSWLNPQKSGVWRSNGDDNRDLPGQSPAGDSCVFFSYQ